MKLVLTPEYTERIAITSTQGKQMDKPYECSALDLNIFRTALRAHAEKVRKLFPEEQLAVEDLIERIDNCDGVFIQVSI